MSINVRTGIIIAASVGIFLILCLTVVVIKVKDSKSSKSDTSKNGDKGKSGGPTNTGTNNNRQNYNQNQNNTSITIRDCLPDDKRHRAIVLEQVIVTILEYFDSAIDANVRQVMKTIHMHLTRPINSDQQNSTDFLLEFDEMNGRYESCEKPDLVPCIEDFYTAFMDLEMAMKNGVPKRVEKNIESISRQKTEIENHIKDKNTTNLEDLVDNLIDDMLILLRIEEGYTNRRIRLCTGFDDSGFKDRYDKSLELSRSGKLRLTEAYSNLISLEKEALERIKDEPKMNLVEARILLNSFKNNTIKGVNQREYEILEEEVDYTDGQSDLIEDLSEEIFDLQVLTFTRVQNKRKLLLANLFGLDASTAWKYFMDIKRTEVVGDIANNSTWELLSALEKEIMNAKRTNTKNVNPRMSYINLRKAWGTMKSTYNMEPTKSVSVIEKEIKKEFSKLADSQLKDDKAMHKIWRMIVRLKFNPKSGGSKSNENETFKIEWSELLKEWSNLKVKLLDKEQEVLMEDAMIADYESKIKKDEIDGNTAMNNLKAMIDSYKEDSSTMNPSDQINGDRLRLAILIDQVLKTTSNLIINSNREVPRQANNIRTNISKLKNSKSNSNVEKLLRRIVVKFVELEKRGIRSPIPAFYTARVKVSAFKEMVVEDINSTEWKQLNEKISEAEIYVWDKNNDQFLMNMLELKHLIPKFEKEIFALVKIEESNVKRKLQELEAKNPTIAKNIEKKLVSFTAKPDSVCFVMVEAYNTIISLKKEVLEELEKGVLPSDSLNEVKKMIESIKVNIVKGVNDKEIEALEAMYDQLKPIAPSHQKINDDIDLLMKRIEKFRINMYVLMQDELFRARYDALNAEIQYASITNGLKYLFGENPVQCDIYYPEWRESYNSLKEFVENLNLNSDKRDPVRKSLNDFYSRNSIAVH